MHDKRNGNSGWRIPAAELESRIISAMTQILRDEVLLLEMIQISDHKIHLIKFLKEKAASLAHELEHGEANQKRILITSLVKQIKLLDGQLTIDFSQSGLQSQLLPPEYLQLGSVEESDIYSITLPFTLKRRGVEVKLILGLKDETTARVDDNLVLTIAKAHAWFDALSTGTVQSIRDLAETEGLDANDISRSLQLAFLSPSIIGVILAGRQPVEITAQTLKRIGDLPYNWHRQQAQLRCP